MKKIDISKIRGNWQEIGIDGKPIAGGNDTIVSIKLVAEKLNEIIDWINRKIRL